MSAVRAVAVKALIVHEGKVLVLQQSADPRYDGAGRFHPPGGMLEPGERLADALAREVHEETGLSVVPGRLLGADQWTANLDGVPYEIVGLFYECHLAPGSSTEPRFDRENAAYRWVGLADLTHVDILEPSQSMIARLLAVN